MSTVAIGLSEHLSGSASGVAVDGSGNVYIAEVDNNRVLKETLSAGSYIQTVVANGTNGLNYPSGVAVDGSGKVYIANFTSGDVYKETPTAGGYSQTLVANSAINGLQAPQGVAVDGSGNVYIADTGNNRVLKETLSSGGYTQSLVASSPDSPYAVAVDGSGNVYIADYTSGIVVKETPTLGGYTQSVIANPANNGWLYVSGVAVDGSGNVYIAAAPNEYVYKETLSGGTYTQSLLPTGIEAYNGAAAPCCGANALGVAVDASGNVYTNGLGVVYRETASAVNFGAVDVGSTSGIVYMYFAFTAEDSASSIAVSNQSSTGRDFAPSQNPNSTCDTPSYNGWFCYVPVTFMPQQLGLRSGVVAVTDSSTPPVVVKAQITGTGVAPQVSFLPGNQTVVASAPANGTLFDPKGVAVDGSGNVYIADTGSGRVLKEALSAGNYTESVIPYTPILNSPGPAGVAVDASGNVYIADPSNGVYKETLSAGVYTQTQISPALAYGVAVDGSGNVYFASGSNVYKDTFAGGSYTLSTIGTDTFLDSVGVAVDNDENVYVADSGTKKRVLKWTLTGSSYVENTVASGLGNPWGVAVDVSGNVYVGDQAGELYKETLSGGTYSQSTLGSNLVPNGVAVDWSGKVYVADAYDHRVYEIGYSRTPTLSFASTSVGSTSSDSPQTVTIENSGTGALIFPTPSSGNNPSISANFSLGSLTTCPVVSSSSSPGILSPGATCIYSVSFSPTISGSVSGYLVLTDNSLNATNPYTTQSISLSGTATGQAQVPIVTLSATSLAFASQTDGTTSAAQTLTLTNSGTAALAIASIATSSGDFAQTDTCGISVAVGGKCTLSVTFTPTMAGTRTGTLTITDNVSGSPQAVALSGTGTISVGPNPGVTFSPTNLTFASQIDGTTSAAQNVMLTNSGTSALTITSIAASGDFIQTNTCGTSVIAGANCTISVSFAPSAAGARTGTLTITDNASGPPQTVALTGGGEAVTVSTSSKGLTIASAGGTATATIQVTPQGGYTGSVNLTCVVDYQGQGKPNDPPTCSVSPAQTQITGNTAATTTLTVSTTAASASAANGLTLKSSGAMLAALIFLGLPRRRYRRGIFLLAILCLTLVGGALGCGGGSSGGGSAPQINPGTTIGSYQVVVTATGSTATASTSTTISLTLQ